MCVDAHMHICTSRKLRSRSLILGELRDDFRGAGWQMCSAMVRRGVRGPALLVAHRLTQKPVGKVEERAWFLSPRPVRASLKNVN